MKIYLNEEVLDSDLETEKTIAEVYTGVKTWIESNGKFLVGFKVDGSEKNQTELNSLSIESVARVDFYVGESLDIVIGTLIELDKYIDKVGDTLFGRDSLTTKETKDFNDGKKWMNSVLRSAETILKLDYKVMNPHGLEKSIEEIIHILVGEEKLDSVKTIEVYLDNLRDLKLFIMDLINRITLFNLDTETVKEILTTYGNNMEVLKKEFISVNENFQSGKELVATELLQHSSGRLHIMISGLISVANRIHEYKIDDLVFDGETLLSINQILTEKLLMVAKSLEDKDIVTAGDILEYELPEVLDKFVPFLKALKEKLV